MASSIRGKRTVMQHDVPPRIETCGPTSDGKQLRGTVPKLMALISKQWPRIMGHEFWHHASLGIFAHFWIMTW